MYTATNISDQQHAPLVPPQPSQPARVKPKLTRRSHTRSRTGCPTCRKRKVKCDETLPVCQNCTALKKVRCGYLDYTPAQIELIRLAHWEADGYDRSKIPFQQQEYNPQQEIEVINKISPDSVHSYTTVTTGTSCSPITDESTPGGQLDFTLNSIPHRTTVPDFMKLPVYFNETTSGRVLRYMVIKMTHENVEHSMGNIMAFHGMLLMGCGALLAKYPELEEYYLETRGVCMKYLLSDLSAANDLNATPLWMMSMTLDASSIFLKGIVNYKQHFKLATGPSSIVQMVYEDPSKFPDTSKRIKFYSDSLLNSTKSVWIPQYDYRILNELKEVIEEFGERYINVQTNENQSAKEHFEDLIDITDFCIDLFSKSSSKDLVLRYPIEKLYELFQRWFSAFPSEAIILDNSNMPANEKVLYTFWHALLKALEAIASSSVYIFSFFLSGFFFTQPFNRTDVTNTLDKEGDDKLRWYFNYCARMISFLDRRINYVTENTILTDPIPVFLDLKDRLKARPLDIHEKCVISFRDTVIKRINYPIESTKLSLFKSTAEMMNYYTTSEATSDSDESLDEILLNLTATDEHEVVDLLNNVNPNTSMLNNDYDPRFTDPIFERPLAYQESDLEFIKRYREDRSLIVQMTEDVKDDDDED